MCRMLTRMNKWKYFIIKPTREALFGSYISIFNRLISIHAHRVFRFDLILFASVLRGIPFDFKDRKYRWLRILSK